MEKDKLIADKVTESNVAVKSNDVGQVLMVPEKYFTYFGQADRKGNLLFTCNKCSSNSKKISCCETSRQNLKKHIEVCTKQHSNSLIM